MKWFVLKNEEVLGPFKKAEVLEQFEEDCLIWGDGMSDWLNKSQWQDSFNQIKKQQKLNQERVQWFFAENQQRQGPYSKPELLEKLKNCTDYTKVHLWHKGLSSWTKFYDCEEIVNAIGQNQRESPRFEINESVFITPIEGEEPQAYMCKAVSISENGIGLVHIPEDIPTGTELNLSISFLKPKEDLSVRVFLISKVDSLSNLSFVGLQGEAKALLVSYVKELEANSQDPLHRAA